MYQDKAHSHNACLTHVAVEDCCGANFLKSSHLFRPAAACIKCTSCERALSCYVSVAQQNPLVFSNGLDYWVTRMSLKIISRPEFSTFPMLTPFKHKALNMPIKKYAFLESLEELMGHFN